MYLHGVPERLAELASDRLCQVGLRALGWNQRDGQPCLTYRHVISLVALHRAISLG